MVGGLIMEYSKNSIYIVGCAKAAAENNVYLAMGITEKDGKNIDGTLHCCMLFFGPDGTFLGRHRKLKPTGSERYI